MTKKFILAGGSGLLGMELAKRLRSQAHEVVILSRSQKPTQDGVRYVQWDGQTLGDWAGELEDSEAIINLTGKSVNCIHTKENRQEILSSRVDSVRVIHQALQQCSNPPRVYVQSSSLAIYGNTTAECDEFAPHGTDFSAMVCEEWERAFFEAEYPQTRQVALRISLALTREGGALPPLEKLVKLYLGGTTGSGKQYFSWIHMDDLMDMFMLAIEDDNITGVYNATAPEPLPNKAFMQELRYALHKPFGLPAPAPAVWFGAYVFMRTDPNLALTGRNCVPKRFEEQGYKFQFPTLGEAFQDIYGSE